MDKKELYKAAKEAYYNGEPIMDDQEFDTLEKEIGLENEGYIGTVHSNAYTIKHPFVMGSLSKVQVHEDKNGNVDWESITEKILSYTKGNPCIITPKYDGCSFEIYYNLNNINKYKVSGRGDGTYGKDIYKQIFSDDRKEWLDEWIDNVTTFFKVNCHAEEFTFRGEALISINKFAKKYADKFTNPRSFVAGCLNRDIESDSDKKMCDDLDLKVYDFRYKNEEGWRDIDWTALVEHCTSLQSINLMPSMDKTLNTGSPMDTSMVEDIYDTMEEFRTLSDYALDGFVIKPKDHYREQNFTSARPKDCVAIKFIPQLQDTVVNNIEWNLGKTDEWIPTIVVDPIVMDGKVVSRASAHNYGYLIKNKICIGTKVQLSLAGDIIPFIYKVTDTSVYDASIGDPNLGITDDMCVEIDGVHARRPVGSGDDHLEHSLYHSALVLNIPGLGPSQIKKVISFVKDDCKGDDFFGIDPKPIPTHFFYVDPAIVEEAILGKNGSKIRKEYEKVIQNITLKDIIKSFNYPLCGDKVSEQIANMWLDLPYEFKGMAYEGYSWAQVNYCGMYKNVMEVLEHIGRPLDTFKAISIEEAKKVVDQIPIIMTGEPNDYASKGAFLTAHPEYRQTGSWKEVKIVFTNSLDSNTGKMKKAKEKGIEIKLY